MLLIIVKIKVIIMLIVLNRIIEIIQKMKNMFLMRIKDQNKRIEIEKENLFHN